VALPACTRCGTTDPRRMYGLMTLWFGPYADVAPDQGYFHLCPRCYRRFVHPHLEKVQGRLAELHPAAAAHLEREAARHRDHDPDRDRESADGEGDAGPFMGGGPPVRNGDSPDRDVSDGLSRSA